tara:strand:- start:13307 stop:13834 length:528 start_codon:yes stop_codon:yes gene_type:complete
MLIDNDLILQWEPKIQRMISNMYRQNQYIADMEKEDLAQELRICIVKAAKSFDETKGTLFHTYLHTSMVNTIRTLVSKSERKVFTKSLDFTFDDFNTMPTELNSALKEDSEVLADVELNNFINSKGLTSLEKQFIQLKIEGLTMQEITEDLGENAYNVRQTLRDKFSDIAFELNE